MVCERAYLAEDSLFYLISNKMTYAGYHLCICNKRRMRPFSRYRTKESQGKKLWNDNFSRTGGITVPETTWNDQTHPLRQPDKQTPPAHVFRNTRACRTRTPRGAQRGALRNPLARGFVARAPSSNGGASIERWWRMWRQTAVIHHVTNGTCRWTRTSSQ